MVANTPSETHAKPRGDGDILRAIEAVDIDGQSIIGDLNMIVDYIKSVSDREEIAEDESNPIHAFNELYHTLRYLRDNPNKPIKPHQQRVLRDAYDTIGILVTCEESREAIPHTNGVMLPHVREQRNEDSRFDASVGSYTSTAPIDGKHAKINAAKYKTLQGLMEDLCARNGIATKQPGMGQTRV